MTEKEMRPIVEKWLRDNYYVVAHEILIAGYCDLAGFRFAPRISRRIPELLTVITVELKISDIVWVLRQATANQYHVNSSYVAMPREKCTRMRKQTVDRFRQQGIGLLAVDDNIEVVVEAVENTTKSIKWMTRKLWRWQRKVLTNGKET